MAFAFMRIFLYGLNLCTYGVLDRLDPVAYLGCSMFSGIVGNRGFRKHMHFHAGELDMCQIGYSIMSTNMKDPD